LKQGTPRPSLVIGTKWNSDLVRDLAISVLTTPAKASAVLIREYITEHVCHNGAEDKGDINPIHMFFSPKAISNVRKTCPKRDTSETTATSACGTDHL